MRTYTDRQKAEALAALDANDGNLSRTSRQIGIPRKTLERWRNGEGTNGDVAQLRHQKKGELAREMTKIAWQLAGDMQLPVRRRKATLVQTATAMAIVIDKAQLLRGEPTSITENADLSYDERVARVAELLDAARARRDGAPADGHPSVV